MDSFSKFQISFGFRTYCSGGQPIMASWKIPESQWATSKIPIKANGNKLEKLEAARSAYLCLPLFVFSFTLLCICVTN